MDTFTLYFNELSINFQAFPKDPKITWRQCIFELINLFDAVRQIRPEARVAFPLNSWHADCDGISLSYRVRTELSSSKDRYRQFLNRVKKIDDIQLDTEVLFSGIATLGFKYTELSVRNWTQGWAISFPNGNKNWELNSLEVDAQSLDERGNLSLPIKNTIGHLAHIDHVKFWTTHIADWGMTVAPSSFLGVLDGHPIVMYSAPLEHEPPHLHLLENPNDHNTIAKFEIEPFKRIRGVPKFDSDMRGWIELYKAQLLHSWKRCQRGGHPYILK